MKRFLNFIGVSLIVAIVAMPLGVFADTVEGQINGAPALNLKVLNAPTVLNEDFTFEVSTLDGADISQALQDFDLGFSFKKAGGTEEAYRLNFAANELFSVQDMGSKFKVTIDVTGKNEISLQSDGTVAGFPTFKQVSIPFADAEYTLEFGEFSNGTVNDMARTNFHFVTKPIIMEVYPGSEVNAGDEMYVIVYDVDGNATALPGDYYISVFDTKAITSLGTSIDGFVTESVLEGLYYFNAPAKAGSYRVNMGSLALVPRTATFDFSVVSTVVPVFNPRVINPQDFDFGGVNLNDPTIPQDIANLFGNDDADVVPIDVVVVPEVPVVDVVLPAGSVELPGFVFDPNDVRERVPAIIDSVVDQGSGGEVLACGDMKSSFWAYEIVNSLLAQGLYPAELTNVAVKCRPEQAVLRKEFTVWLLKAYYPDEVAGIQAFHNNYNYAKSPFKDVKGTDVYDPYIILAAQLKIVSGNPDGTFKPNNVINRAEVLKILLRSSDLFKATNGEVAALGAEFNPVGRFVDEDNVDWYTTYLQYAVEHGIIEGRTEMRNGRAVKVSAMGEGVLFGEAAKILYLARQ